MSISNDIMEYLVGLPKEQLARQDPATVAAAIGADTNKVSKLMWSLEHTGRIKMNRVGRTITGVAELTRPVSQRGRRAPVSPRTATRTDYSTGPLRAVQTPLLDRYEQAKAQASKIESGEGSEFFAVSFRSSPMAEEGLRLREALTRVQHQYAELSSQYKVLIYENEGLKQRSRDKVNGIASEIAKRDAELARER